MITQRFEFTKDFTKEWNNSVYSRLSKILCGFKDQVRARPSGEKCGLARILHEGGRDMVESERYFRQLLKKNAFYPVTDCPCHFIEYKHQAGR